MEIMELRDALSEWRRLCEKRYKLSNVAYMDLMYAHCSVLGAYVRFAVREAAGLKWE